MNICLRAVSHWREYSLQVLAEKVSSLVLPLFIHTDASARITRASTRRHSRWKRLAHSLARVNWQNRLLFHFILTSFSRYHVQKW